MRLPSTGCRILRRDGPDPDPRPARAPGARPHVRARRPPAARGRVRACRRARPARLGRPDPGGRHRGAAPGRLVSRAGSAGRAGRSSSRSSSTSSSASRPAACGRTSRAPTTSCSTPIAEQRRRYLDPSLRGERSGSYAITEDGAGSDARTLRATAVRDAATGEYVLNGEKWFVTGPDDTDFMIFHCLVVDGDDRGGRPSSWSTTTRPAWSSSTTRTTPTPSPTVIPSSC